MTDRIVVAGSSGLIGSALVAALRRDGIEVTQLVRRPPSTPDEVEWQPGKAPLDPGVLNGATAVVNLGGSSISRMPWLHTYRQTLVASRIQPTRTIARAIRELGTDAPTFVSASAVGFYGHRPGETLDETSEPGLTYLAKVCVRWEQMASAAGSDARVVLLRSAPVLHPQGVLKPLMLLTRLGVAGPLGSGAQVWPWISLQDEVGAIRHVIDREMDGPVNLTGPTPATEDEIGRELARRMDRPYRIRAPRWALRTVLGAAAADSLLLADATVVPTRLERSGFSFTHPTMPDAVAAALAA